MRPMQELVTEYCWGAVWTRPGLDRRTRSLINLGMLTALGSRPRARGARARRAHQRRDRDRDPGDAAAGGDLLRRARRDGGVPPRRRRALGSRAGRRERRRRDRARAPARGVDRGARLVERGLERLPRGRPGLLRALPRPGRAPVAPRPAPAKVKALIQLSVDAAATHLHAPGVRHHIASALAHGASPAEIIETLELTSTMGIHATNVGVPILLEELAARRARRWTTAR